MYDSEANQKKFGTTDIEYVVPIIAYISVVCCSVLQFKLEDDPATLRLW